MKKNKKEVERKIKTEDYDIGKVIIVRKDTGEIIEDREMTAEEKQLEFDFENPEVVKNHE